MSRIFTPDYLNLSSPLQPLPDSASPTIGEYTNYPIGLALHDYCEWYWRIRIWTWQMSGTASSNTGAPSSINIGNVNGFQSNVISDEYQLFSSNYIQIDPSVYDVYNSDNTCGWVVPTFIIDYSQTILFRGLYYPWIKLALEGYGQDSSGASSTQGYSDVDNSSLPGWTTQTVSFHGQSITIGFINIGTRVSFTMGDIVPGEWFSYSGQFNTSTGSPA